mgnify:CR=1 FL=1
MAKDSTASNSVSAGNPFQSLNGGRKNKDRAWAGLFAVSTYLVVIFALFVFGDILSKGLPVLFKAEAPFVNVDFLTKSPETLVVYENGAGETVRMDNPDFLKFQKEHPEETFDNVKTHSYSGGGILGPLVGTACLVVICMVAALLVGISASIYLNEYAKQGRMVNWIRLAIMNLAGVPSIVFGMFGFAFFCLSPWFPKFTYTPNYENVAELFGHQLVWKIIGTNGYFSFEGWGNSMIAGGFTLAVMVLPVIITACEESLRAVPRGFREAALALGANKWQCIRTAVLPYASPGILTASVLGITRVAGETAPIMFTAAVAMKGKLPWQEASGNGAFWLSDFLSQSVEALPYHIYTVALKVPRSKDTESMQDGAILVFMLLVMLFAGISIALRARARKKLKW